MSIRGIDTNLIVPRTADMVREAAPQQQQAALAQQFGAMMTEQAVEHNATITQEVYKGKESDAVDEDGEGNGSEQQAGEQKRRKDKEPGRGDPNYAGMSTSTFDVKA